MRRAGTLGILGCALLALGCGQKFDLPPQPEDGRTPTPGKYNVAKIWEIDQPGDLVSQGSYLYVIEAESRVTAYFTRAQDPGHPQFVRPFEGLTRPVRICLARRDSTFLFVADAGDTTIKRYHFTGGAPRAVLRDTTWTGEFSGIAADEHLNLFVSFASRDTILEYDVNGARVRLIADAGSGRGYVNAPHQLFWNGAHLIVADTGKNWVQRLRGDTTWVAAPGEPIGEAFPLDAPEDVAADRLGELIYVADTGNDRVLKFLATGALVDSVYSPTYAETPLPEPIDAPRYVAVEEELVFVSDTPRNRIVAFFLASQ